MKICLLCGYSVVAHLYAGIGIAFVPGGLNEVAPQGEGVDAGAGSHASVIDFPGVLPGDGFPRDNPPACEVPREGPVEGYYRADFPGKGEKVNLGPDPLDRPSGSEHDSVALLLTETERLRGLPAYRPGAREKRSVEIKGNQAPHQILPASSLSIARWAMSWRQNMPFQLIFSASA